MSGPATLQMDVASMDPAKVIAVLAKFGDRFKSPIVARTVASCGGAPLITLIGYGDLNFQTWRSAKYWAGVCSPLKSDYELNARPSVMDGSTVAQITRWLEDSIHVLKVFQRLYPGEHIRRVNWEERFAAGPAFNAVNALRLRDLVNTTTQYADEPAFSYENMSRFVRHLSDTDTEDDTCEVQDAEEVGGESWEDIKFEEGMGSEDDDWTAIGTTLN